MRWCSCRARPSRGRAPWPHCTERRARSSSCTMPRSMFPPAARTLLVLALLSSPLAAQELPFTHYTPNDQVPLPSASVQKIVQDHLGYIWFAFYSSGLTRYDGHAMESYGTADGLRSEEHTSELQSRLHL